MVKQKVQNRLKELLARKERIEGRKITRRTMAAETGISLSSVQAWANNTVTRYDADQIAVFCQYLGCRVSELVILIEDDEDFGLQESEDTALLAAVS